MLIVLLCAVLLPSVSASDYHYIKDYIKYSDFYPKFNWSTVPKEELSAFLQWDKVNTSLRDLGSKQNLFMGAEFNVDHLLIPPFTSLDKMQYSMSTAGNACKWAATQPNAHKFTMQKCFAGLTYSIKTDQQFRAHNLCWGKYNPKWLTEGNYRPNQLQHILRHHITTVIKQLGGHGSVYCYDVVNEALNETGLKPADPWYPAVPDYVQDAFRAASKAAPSSVKLFYNDYGGEGMNEKSDTIYNHIKKWKDEHVLVSGVGLQMHVSIDHFPPFSEVQENMKRLAALDLEVHITEMDVDCDPCGKEELAKQAYIYHGMLKACLEVNACKNFETWGFTDKYTWRGTKEHPLPFDQHYNPKPAFWALVKALKGY